MNERLRQFEKESKLEIFGLGARREIWEKALEKYAELIVRECIDICRYHPSGIVSNNWRADVVAQDIMSKFQEHFGVEE